MINFVTHLWDDGVHNKEHVDRLYRAVKRNTKKKFRFILFTTQVLEKFAEGIEVMPLDAGKFDHSKDYSQRLHLFNKEYCERVVGKRYVQIDLDTLIVGNIDDILSYKEEFVAYRDPRFFKAISANFMIRNSDVLNEVYDGFNGTIQFPKHIQTTRQDSSLVSFFWEQNRPESLLLIQEDGFYHINHVDELIALPENARVIFFGSDYMQEPYCHIPWVKHYGK